MQELVLNTCLLDLVKWSSLPEARPRNMITDSAPLRVPIANESTERALETSRKIAERELNPGSESLNQALLHEVDFNAEVFFKAVDFFLKVIELAHVHTTIGRGISDCSYIKSKPKECVDHALSILTRLFTIADPFKKIIDKYLSSLEEKSFSRYPGYERRMDTFGCMKISSWQEFVNLLKDGKIYPDTVKNELLSRSLVGIFDQSHPLHIDSDLEGSFVVRIGADHLKQIWEMFPTWHIDPFDNEIKNSVEYMSNNKKV